MNKLSRQVSSAYNLSTCGFQLFNPLKELEESKNLDQAIWSIPRFFLD